MSSKFSKSAYKDINKAHYPSHVVGDNRMTFDFSLTPRVVDTKEYDLFIRYCQTGKHPNLGGPDNKGGSKQTKITDYFPALTENERGLHALAEACTCPVERDVTANKIHVAYMEKRRNRHNDCRKVSTAKDKR